MKIKSIKKVILDEEKQYYDVVNAYPYNNFLVKTNSGYVCSHNCMFDEIDFIRNQDIDKQKEKAEDMMDTAIGGMKTRFIKNGKNPSLLILASSKRSDKSFLEEHTKKKLESESENVLIIEDAVWNVHPQGTFSKNTFKFAVGNKFLNSTFIRENEDEELYIKKGYRILNIPIDFKEDFILNPDRALCDFAGIASSELSKYISGQAVTDIINPNLQNPFTKDIIEVGNAPEDKAQYSDFFDITKVPNDIKNKPLFIHLDMSVSGDMTGIAGVCIKGKKPSTDTNSQNKDLFYSLVFSVSIKAPKGRQISFEKNRQFIYWLKEQGFKIKGISSDTFQSYDTGQLLKDKGYPYEVLSVDRVDTSSRICIPYQYFKSTIYEKRMEIYDSKTLIEEIVNLERNVNTGKVDHPADFRKDISDATCGALYQASKHAEEFAYDYGENLESIANINMNKSDMMKQQLTVDFEQALRETLAQNYLQQNEQGNGLLVSNNIEKPKEIENLMNISDGIMVW